MSLATLPTELHHYILEFLNWEDHLYASQACNLWHQILTKSHFQQMRYMPGTLTGRDHRALLKSRPGPRTHWYTFESNVGIHAILDHSYSFYIRVSNHKIADFYYEKPGWASDRNISLKAYPERYINITSSPILRDPLFSPFAELKYSEWVLSHIELQIDSNIGFFKYDWRGKNLGRKSLEEAGGLSASIKNILSWIIKDVTSKENSFLYNKPDFVCRVSFNERCQQELPPDVWSTILYMKPWGI